MEPLVEVSIAKGDFGTIEGYIFRVEGGACYSIEHAPQCNNVKVTEIIFLAERDLRTRMKSEFC